MAKLLAVSSATGATGLAAAIDGELSRGTEGRVLVSAAKPVRLLPRLGVGKPVGGGILLLLAGTCAEQTLSVPGITIADGGASASTGGEPTPTRRRLPAPAPPPSPPT